MASNKRVEWNKSAGGKNSGGNNLPFLFKQKIA